MQTQKAYAGLEVACFTETGPVRKRNEDACALPPPWADQDGLGMLLVVADGVGGLPGGAAASRDAVGFLQSIYYAPAGSRTPAERLNEAVQTVNTLNRRSQERKSENERLTTLVAAVIRAEEFWIANVGDSRAYLCRTGEPPRQLTQDHKAVQSQAITHAIGLEDECQVDLYRYTWQPGDVLVLCSDGLAALPAPELTSLVLTLPAADAAAALVHQAQELDGSDNATAVVARWRKGRAGKRQAAQTKTARTGQRRTISARAKARTGVQGGRLSLGLVLGLLLGWLTAAALVYAAIAGGYLNGF